MNKTLKISNIELITKDNEAMSEFYSKYLGLKVISNHNNSIVLGFDNVGLLNLVQKDNLSFAKDKISGLYHSAFVVGSQSHLAKIVSKLLDAKPQLYQGSSDHIVTEAFYFSDPEGNGVEIYYDKPLTEWQFDNNGKPIMGSKYINEAEYIKKHFTQDSINQSISIGHIHLKVADIQKSKDFYLNLLNFDMIIEMPQALFVSRDNYHHHIGMNTWNSNLPTQKNITNYGLNHFTIEFNEKKQFGNVIEKLKASNYSYQKINDSSISVYDPSNILINIVLKP